MTIVSARLFAFAMAMFGSIPVQAQTLESWIRSGAVPNSPSPPLELRALLNRVPQGDLEISVFLTKWKAGSRTPIHNHEYGGLKCLLQGEATLYIENQQPQNYSAPSCVQMPPGVSMVNVASGKDDPTFYVIFIGKRGHPYWQVTEQGISPDLLHLFSNADHGH